MEMGKDKRIARRLFVFWVICYTIFNLGSSVYISYQQVFEGNDPRFVPSAFQIFTFVIILLYFIPLLSVVLHFAKLSSSKGLQKIATIILTILVIAVVFMLLGTLFVFAVPEVWSSLMAM